MVVLVGQTANSRRVGRLYNDAGDEIAADETHGKCLEGEGRKRSMTSFVQHANQKQKNGSLRLTFSLCSF